MKKYILRAAPVVLGALAGYAYYHFVGCESGCAIQSNPWTSTLYGGLVGLIFAFPTTKKEKLHDDERQGNH
jgi:xanthine/uracil permease